MSSEARRKNTRVRPMLPRRNSMAFPRELREAIPPQYDGRVLELDSISGQASNTELFGPLVQLKLVVKETGKQSGSFVVVMRLQADAASKLAATLGELANQAGGQAGLSTRAGSPPS